MTTFDNICAHTWFSFCRVTMLPAFQPELGPLLSSSDCMINSEWTLDV